LRKSQLASTLAMLQPLCHPPCGPMFYMLVDRKCNIHYSRLSALGVMMAAHLPHSPSHTRYLLRRSAIFNHSLQATIHFRQLFTSGNYSLQATIHFRQLFTSGNCGISVDLPTTFHSLYFY
jgi:hypothetical protein